MTAEELQVKLRQQTGRPYIVKDANPFNEGSMFQLGEEGLRGWHLPLATVEQIEGFVMKSFLDEWKKSWTS